MWQKILPPSNFTPHLDSYTVSTLFGIKCALEGLSCLGFLLALSCLKKSKAATPESSVLLCLALRNSDARGHVGHQSCKTSACSLRGEAQRLYFGGLRRLRLLLPWLSWLLLFFFRETLLLAGWGRWPCSLWKGCPCVRFPEQLFWLASCYLEKMPLKCTDWRSSAASPTR